MGIARHRRIASVIVLAFVITAFAAVGAGGSAKKHSVAAPTIAPVLASGVAPVRGGTVTVTASAPQNLQFTVNNGVQNTSATVTGTATLTCQ